MAVSTSSGFHTYSSWGRTRGPKNIIDPDHTSPTSVVLTGAGGLGTATSAAYITENQRFLHVSAIAAGDNQSNTIQVQVYMHASGQWADLDGATLAVTGDRKHKVFEIFGVDQVRFLVTGLADDETCTIFPACSTF